MIKGDFVVTGPDVEPMKFKTRAEARDWCRTHHPGSPRSAPAAEGRARNPENDRVGEANGARAAGVLRAESEPVRAGERHSHV
jgi:hypothetical protein